MASTHRFGALCAAILAATAAHACDAPPTEDNDGDGARLGETSAALTQSLRLPFPPGHTWYICQSYVGFSHRSNRPFDIGWTKASCNAGNDDTGGKPITAPGAGRITRLPSTAAGGDFMCLSLTGGGAIVLGHVKPEPGMRVGSTVTAGQKVATVRSANDPAGQNAGIAHLHFEAFSGSDCYVGAAQAFTGAWRMQCAPDLPFNATYGFYNGTAITACAPDAGARDAARDDGGAVDASRDAAMTDGEDASTASPSPSTSSEEPSNEAAREPEPDADGAEHGGCAAAPRARRGAGRDGTASAAALGCVLAVLAVLAIERRRRSPDRGARPGRQTLDRSRAIVGTEPRASGG